MYDTLLLIDPDATVTLQAVEDELRRFYDGKLRAPRAIERDGSQLRVGFPGFLFYVDHNTADHVVEESREMAELAAEGHPQADRIARSKERLEIGSHGDDDDMVYFNDFVFIVECAEKVGRVYQFDPYEGKFMDQG